MDGWVIREKGKKGLVLSRELDGVRFKVFTSAGGDVVKRLVLFYRGERRDFRELCARLHFLLRELDRECRVRTDYKVAMGVGVVDIRAVFRSWDKFNGFFERVERVVESHAGSSS